MLHPQYQNNVYVSCLPRFFLLALSPSDPPISSLSSQQFYCLDFTMSDIKIHFRGCSLSWYSMHRVVWDHQLLI